MRFVCGFADGEKFVEREQGLAGFLRMGVAQGSGVGFEDGFEMGGKAMSLAKVVGDGFERADGVVEIAPAGFEGVLAFGVDGVEIIGLVEAVAGFRGKFEPAAGSGARGHGKAFEFLGDKVQKFVMRCAPIVAGHVGGNGKMHAPFEIGFVSFFGVTDVDAGGAWKLAPWDAVGEHGSILPGIGLVGNEVCAKSCAVGLRTMPEHGLQNMLLKIK